MSVASVQTRYEIDELAYPVRKWLVNGILGLSVVLLALSLWIAYVVNDFVTEPIRACAVTYEAKTFCGDQLTRAGQRRSQALIDAWVDKGRPARFSFRQGGSGE